MASTAIVPRHLCAETSIVQLPPRAPRVLNNFVTEIVRATGLVGNEPHSVRIDNPRKGWLFFRLTAVTGRSGAVKLNIGLEGGAEYEVIGQGRGQTKTTEAMRFLDKGEYSIRLNMKDAEVGLLEIRLIPIIIYERMLGNFRGMEGFPEYKREFLQRCGMLDCINTIGTYDGFSWRREWIDQGRHVIRIAGGINNYHAPDEAYWHWRGSMNNPGGQGIIIDEFYPRLSKYFPGWVEALKRVKKDEPNMLCFLYTAGNSESLRTLIEPLKDIQDFYLAPEEQVEEDRRTEKEVIREGFAKNSIASYKNSYFPNVSERTVHSVGIFSGPSENKYNDDVHPDRNWKVLKELHIHELATDPIHRNVAGIDLYQSPQCKPEYLRWMAKLLRHYCIEGSSDRITSDPYELSHIQNPDFVNGIEGWAIDPAEVGSIAIKTLKGYGLNVQGRHAGVGVGDTAVWMKRQEDKPNTIRQKIRNLQNGRVYSVTMYTADLNNMNRRQLHSVGLRVAKARDMPGTEVHNAWRHEPHDDFGGNDTWSNYHQILFRAESETAELIISDWLYPEVPTGPVGQELLFNFIQVEPYFMADGK